MSSKLQQRLQALALPDAREQLDAINRGIEKESLRITPKGKLAQTPHPPSLGSALTHASITTDYSEALLEFITPVSTSIEASLTTLENIHSFVQQQLGDELLWSASMPCVMTGDADIPVALYGDSNVGRMKTVYRYGLGNRYGRLMQTIAGIHYNFSMPAAFWDREWSEAGKPGEIQDYITERYLDLIRNFRRYSWLLIYLFGASPAVCASFLKGRENHDLQPFDKEGKSLYLPYGTALRMGGLGYNSEAQKELDVCYNTLDNYVTTLSSAIMKPHAEYASIPSGKDGNYQQLNDSLLQIENEFYSPIRPKRVTQSGETAINALVRAGIEYVEVRCVDVSPFCPVGIDSDQIRFLDIFLMYCLLEESPDCDNREQESQAANLEAVVSRGRKPGLQLQRNGEMIELTQWGHELLQNMEPIASLFDEVREHAQYRSALQQQVAKVADTELTPSARILREMHEKNLPFFRLAMAYSKQWADYFRQRPLPVTEQAYFEEEAIRSLKAQRDIEAGDEITFEEYLAKFFAQYQTL